MKNRAHITRYVFAILCLILGSNTGYAQTLFEQKFQFANAQDQTVKSETSIPLITPNTVWQLSGVNTSSKTKLIIIEIGQHKAAYRNRINQERGVLPGAFTLQLYPYGFKTSKGTPLIFNNETRIKIFSLDNDKAITDFKLSLKKAPNLEALYALDFGPEDQVVWQGFEPVAPSHPLLAQNPNNKNLTAFTRLSLDPLIRDGVSGLISLKLPLPKGQWRLHLWTEDVGYWQTLPEQIERRIRINGQDRDYQLNPPWQWVGQRYTQNKHRLSQFNKLSNLTSWRAIGQYRGDYKQFDLESYKDELHIELAGANQIATTITALVVERINQNVLADINFERASWFNSRWPLLPYQQKSHSKKTRSKPYRLTPNNPLFITIPLNKSISLNNINWEKTPFNIEKRVTIMQLERNLGSYTANPAGSFLAIKPILISAEKKDQPLSETLHLTIKAPENLTAGIYPLTIIDDISKQPLKKIHIQLLDVLLPELKKPVGVYLDLAPHLFLSYERKGASEKQLLCDLNTLSSLALSGVAPPFPLPKNKALLKGYQNRLETLYTLGFKPPFLDYASLKNLRFQFGQDQTSGLLGKLSQAASKQPRSIAISIADEPSNASSNGIEIKQMASLVDNSQTVNLDKNANVLLKAAHLNHPKDSKWLGEIDIALINQGYGVNRQRIQKIRNKDVEVWLYNMSNKRLAAGFFLWKHSLSGYLQWHARMPTADPFDPTDGREDDQQLLPIMGKVCAPVADLHPQLIAIAEGVTDHRWLNWLDQMSQHSILAYKLRQKLFKKIPSAWQNAENITPEQLQTWRNDIEELALLILKKD